MGFSGPSATNSAGKKIFEARRAVAVGADGAIAGGFASGDRPSALLYLRQTLLNPDERRRGALDAMNYAASLGVTTHLDQGAFQATNTPERRRGARRQLHDAAAVPRAARARAGTVRLRINYLHKDADAGADHARASGCSNTFPFFGDDMIRTGGIGEFIARPARPAFLDAAKLLARGRLARRGALA